MPSRSLKDAFYEKAVSLYHRHPDWDWDKLTFEVFKQRYPYRIVKHLGTLKYSKGWVEHYVDFYIFNGKEFKHEYVTFENEILLETYTVPKRYMERIKLWIGKHLMNACRANPECPYKPLLPEWSEET